MRLESNVNVTYKAFKSKEEVLKKGFSAEQISYTKNISAGGLLFASKEPLAIGSFVELQIELPDGSKPLECLARVVRVDEIRPDEDYNIAVCFLGITGAQRVRLEKFVVGT
jgi:hypothetical protein